jgi:signal transduction histidine kinase
VSSPQVPLGSLREAAIPTIVTAAQVAEHSRRLEEFARRVPRPALDAALAAAPAPLSETTIDRLAFACATVGESFAKGGPASRSGKEQAIRNLSSQAQAAQIQQEANRDSQRLQPQGDYAVIFNDAASVNGLNVPALPAPQALEAEIMRPLWIRGVGTPVVGDTLVLARRVRVGGADWLQACWLDWPLMRGQLLASIRDLLPEADLLPVRDDSPQVQRLATLPLVPQAGASLPDWREPSHPVVDPPLLAAWAGVLLALVAGAVLLNGALVLSERRGAFVSAVTHELRTPLTTFRLYTDLLADGHVVDDSERQRCLDTLRTEAGRLGHLVENVLGYARLERTPLPTTALGVSALVDGMYGRLQERAARAGLALELALSPEVAPLALRGEAQAIERILVNLVDNACKYAATASDRRLHLEIARRAGQVCFTVRDHGPGIPPDLTRRLFTPFAKSAAEAARTAPGIGLGLALSRRLARQLGGGLDYRPPSDGGAAFVLGLPLAG